MKSEQYFRRFQKRLRKHSVFGHLLGLWVSRKFTKSGILVVSEGRPLPKILNKGGTIECGNCQLYSGTRFEVGPGASIRIGSGTYINRNTLVIAEEKVTIGKNCKISWDVIIMDTDQHPLNSETIKRKPVIIEDKAWIGCRSIILKGVTIGEGAVVAAGSIVTKSIPPYTIFGGSPAKYLGDVRHGSCDSVMNKTGTSA